MQDMHLYCEKIESVLTNSGFHKEEISFSDFKVAFTRRGFLTSLVFLIVEVNDKDFNASSIKNLVESGRQWCADNLKATWIVKESGLNLVLLHDGQIGSNDIKGQVDSTGFHSSICQSITTLNVTNGSVAQEKTWVVIGRVKKALRKLNEIA